MEETGIVSFIGHSVMNNALILNRICKAMDKNERLKARLVSKTWNAEIIRRIRFDQRPFSSLEWTTVKQTPCDFGKLLILLSKSQNPEILLQKLKVNKLINCTTIQAQEFFQKYGIHIKSLGFELVTNGIPLQNILQDFCPNLTSLEINLQELDKNTRRVVHSIKLRGNTLLSNLKRLELNAMELYLGFVGFEEIARLYAELIKSANSLSYLRVPMTILQYLVPLLLQPNYWGEKPLQTLQTLIVYDGFIDMKVEEKLHALTSLLSIVTDCVENLELKCRLEPDDDQWAPLNFPVMNKVKRFVIRVDSLPEHPLFPIQKLFAYMPSLQELKVKDNVWELIDLNRDHLELEKYIFKCDDEVNCYKGVTSLNLRGLQHEVYTTNCVQKFCNLFPNLRRLTFTLKLPLLFEANVVEFLDEVSTEISKLHKLEFLQIQVNHFCVVLWRIKNSQFDIEFRQQFRKLFLLPKLKHFTIKSDSCFFSRLMQNLTTEFPEIKTVFKKINESQELFDD